MPQDDPRIGETWRHGKTKQDVLVRDITVRSVGSELHHVAVHFTTPNTNECEILGFMEFIGRYRFVR